MKAEDDWLRGTVPGAEELAAAAAVLERVAGDEEGFAAGRAGAQDDALHDVRRRALSGLFAAPRGPSSRAAEETVAGALLADLQR